MDKTNYFVDAATKEFKLDKNVKGKLLKVRTAYFIDYIKANKKAKLDDLSKLKKRKSPNAVNQNFNIKLRENSGKNSSEIHPS